MPQGKAVGDQPGKICGESVSAPCSWMVPLHYCLVPTAFPQGGVTRIPLRGKGWFGSAEPSQTQACPDRVVGSQWEKEETE